MMVMVMMMMMTMMMMMMMMMMIVIITALKKGNSRKSVTWSAVPDAPMLVYVRMRR